MSKIVYQCDQCKNAFETEQLAAECEEKHENLKQQDENEKKFDNQFHHEFGGYEKSRDFCQFCNKTLATYSICESHHNGSIERDGLIEYIEQEQLLFNRSCCRDCYHKYRIPMIQSAREIGIDLSGKRCHLDGEPQPWNCEGMNI